jgi:hypothetical protein
MVHEQTILASERLRDDLLDMKKLLRSRYASASRQVTADEHRTMAARLAETWLVEIATDPEVAVAIGTSTLGDLNIHFQRILTFSEHATIRSRYDAELRAILDDYSIHVIVPLKRARGLNARLLPQAHSARTIVHSAFVGHSFAADDTKVSQCIMDTLSSLGLKVATGERPKAELISNKVKQLIEEHSIFVGVFTRRDKLANKSEWTTSPWVIDEKAYAVGRQKPLILLKEVGVGSIGGIQGDYEFLEFSRDALEGLVVRLIQLFEITNGGLRK